MTESLRQNRLRKHGLVFRVHRLAKDSYVHQNKTPSMLHAIENDLFRHGSRNRISNMSGRMLALLSQFELEKGRMSPSLRSEYRDRFLRLATRLSDESHAIAMLLAEIALRMPEGKIYVLHLD